MDGAIRLRNVLDSALVAETFHDLQRLFDYPEEVKLLCRRTDLGCGYTPSGIEGVRDLPKDTCRSFWDIGPPGMNQFPMGFNARSIDALFVVVQRVASATFREAHPDLAELIKGGMHGLRATSFRSVPANEIVMEGHHDIGLCTAFVGGSPKGLQGRREKIWEEIENPLGDLIIANGTALRLYDPNIPLFRHRVVSAGESRISLAFFLEPAPQVRLPNGELAEDRIRRIASRIRLPDPT